MRVIKVFAAGFLCIITIVCSRPDDLDLAETYFPMGLDYEWTYERDDGGWGVTDFDEWGYPIESSWHKYDTFTITIKDSFLIFRGWEFELDGGNFLDVGTYPKITGDKIRVFGKRVEIEPETTAYVYLKGLEVRYTGDTLLITLKDGKEITRSGVGKEEIDQSTRRILGIGIVYQSWTSYSSGHVSSMGTFINDRLLYLIKNGDTVWHHEDTISNIIF